jgi:putative nucleotidyltransferase with HDIG domain
MASPSLPLIDVDRLRLGMYVVLDVGWRNHPFIADSFTIRTEEQLRQLRAMGPTQIRWCPDRSSIRPLPGPATPASPPTGEPAPVGNSATEATPAPIAQAPVVLAAAAQWLETEPATESEWQALSLRRVEDGYRNVAQGHLRFLKHLGSDPVAAREQAEQLGDTLYNAVADCHAPAVRLLSQGVDAAASGHAVATAALALLLARDCGFTPEEQREAALAGLLHDIGKTRIPSFLHEDNGRLTAFERGSYRRHVELGVELARSLDLPPTVIRAIAEHHEHTDGSGFPTGRCGDRIAPASRVVAIANRYLNLVRPQHADVGMTPHQAMQQMYGVERAHFDPTYLSHFVRVMGVYPPGTLVELTDGRMAVVIASRPGASLSPRVQLVEAPDAQVPGVAIDIDGEGELRVRCSLLPAQLNPSWARRSRELARSAVYIEPQTSPEWSAWSDSASTQTQVF